MTIKELKQELKGLPDDAEALFAIWTSEDGYTYFRLKKSNKRIAKINTGGQVAIISTADNCRADKMIEKNNSFEY